MCLLERGGFSRFYDSATALWDRLVQLCPVVARDSLATVWIDFQPSNKGPCSDFLERWAISIETGQAGRR